MKNIKFLVAISLLGVSLLSMGQTKENPWSIGLYGVKTEYMGDLALYSNEWSTSTTINTTQKTIFNFSSLYGGGALSFDRYLNSYLDLGLYSSFGTVGFKDGSQVDRVPRSFNAKLSNSNLHLRLKFLGDDDARLVPYITVGGGLLVYMKDKGITVNSVDDTVGVATDFPKKNALAVIVTGGAGLEYKISDHISVRYQGDFGWTNRDNIDFYTRDKSTDWQFQQSLGVIYSFGGKKKAAKVVEPLPQPVPQPAPAPKPALAPAPQPVVVPQPTPAPVSQPVVVPQTAPAPAPQPAVVPQPTPAPAPQPAPSSK